MPKKVIICVSIFICLSLIFTSLLPIAKAAPAGWSDDQNLTNNSTNDDHPSIAADGDRIHVAWTHTVTAGSEYQINYMNSSDGGYTWSSSKQISSSDLAAEDASIGVDGENIHIVWDDTKTLDDEIFYRNSTDGGLSWNDERRLTLDDGNKSNGAFLGVNGDNLHVFWIDSRDPGEAWWFEIYYLRSTDGGKTWDNGTGGNVGRRLTHADELSAPNDVAINGTNVHLIYSDERDGDMDIYYQMSPDNGVTWEDGKGNIGGEFELAESSNKLDFASIAVNGSIIHVVWVEQTWPGPNYYIWYRNSTDNGNNWNAARQLVGPVPRMGRPSISCYQSNIYMVWDDSREDDTSTEVYSKNSTDSGGNWGSTTRLTYSLGYDSTWPKIIMSEGKKYVVWYDERDGNDEIYFKRSPDFASPIPEFSNLLIPVLAVPTIIFSIEFVFKRKNP